MSYSRTRDPKLASAALTRKVLDQSIFVNELLNDTLSAFEYGQRRLMTELVYGTIRNLKHIDFWISRAFNKPFKRIDPDLLSMIRISLYQIIFMSNREPHSIVNESAELIKQSAGEKAAGFVNFILREILRNGTDMENMMKLLGNDNDKFLQTYYSYPEWLYKRISEVLPGEPVETYLKILNRPLGITLRVEGDDCRREELIEKLKIQGAEAVPAKDCKYGIYTTKAVNFDMVKNIEGVYIQDESSQLAVYEMDIRKGDRILDICAAPGGKTLFASFLTGETGLVTAADVNRHRLNILAETAIKYRKKNIEVKLHDSTVVNPDWQGVFDRVLVDAPCSALGTIRRHPEVKWIKKDTDPAKMAIMAEKILDCSSGYVKPGGILLFSVCTFTREETTEQVQNFILRHPEFRIEKAYYTVSSLDDNRDAFFICKMRRIK